MDSFRAKIWIGGCIHESLIPGLVEALHKDEASDDFGGATIDENCTEEQLFAYLDKESLLSFECDNAEIGEFKATEAFCWQHKIPFNRESDSYAGYLGEQAYYRPGMQTLLITFFDDTGVEVVRGDSVREAIDLLEKYFIELDSHPHPGSDSRLVSMKILRGVCPKIPEKLKTFCTNNITT